MLINRTSHLLKSILLVEYHILILYNGCWRQLTKDFFFPKLMYARVIVVCLYYFGSLNKILDRLFGRGLSVAFKMFDRSSNRAL